MSEQVEMEQEENKEVDAVQATTSGSTEKKRFEVKKWNAVALWAWGDYYLTKIYFLIYIY